MVRRRSPVAKNGCRPLDLAAWRRARCWCPQVQTTLALPHTYALFGNSHVRAQRSTVSLAHFCLSPVRCTVLTTRWCEAKDPPSKQKSLQNRKTTAMWLKCRPTLTFAKRDSRWVTNSAATQRGHVTAPRRPCKMGVRLFPPTPGAANALAPPRPEAMANETIHGRDIDLRAPPQQLPHNSESGQGDVSVHPRTAQAVTTTTELAPQDSANATRKRAQVPFRCATQSSLSRRCRRRQILVMRRIVLSTTQRQSRHVCHDVAPQHNTGILTA